MIEVEQSTQALGFMNRPVLTLCSFVGEGDDIGEPLMIAFMLVVGQKLLERVAQGTFAKENQLIGIWVAMTFSFQWGLRERIA